LDKSKQQPIVLNKINLDNTINIIKNINKITLKDTNLIEEKQMPKYEKKENSNNNLYNSNSRVLNKNEHFLDKKIKKQALLDMVKNENNHIHNFEERLDKLISKDSYENYFLFL